MWSIYPAQIEPIVRWLGVRVSGLLSDDAYARLVVRGFEHRHLDPDVAAVFPNSAAVNEALRALVKIAQRGRAAKPRSRKRA